MLARHFVHRKGLPMPNTTALVPLMVDHCWDQMCWEILSHSFTPQNRTHVRGSTRVIKTDDTADLTSWPLRGLPVTRGGADKPTFKLTDFGGKADGVTDNLPAFNKAFAELARSSGGTLIIPNLGVSTTSHHIPDTNESIYLTLPLRITVSNLTLVLEAGTRLKAKTDTVLSHTGDWPTVLPWKNGIDGTELQYAPFIHAVNVSDFVITGSGTVDSDGFFWYTSNWCGGGHCKSKLPHARPRLAVVEGSKRVELSNFTTNVSGFWNLVVLETTDVHIHHVRVRNPSGGRGECGGPQHQPGDCFGPNADGIVSNTIGRSAPLDLSVKATGLVMCCP